MALGGGTWTTQNKELPGAYINFVSAASATAVLSDRGIATMPLELDWGPDDEIFTVTSEDFQKHSTKIFGYSYDNDKMKGLSDLFMGAKTLYAYRLNSGGEKAYNDYATALYSGIRGNDIMIAIQTNADDQTQWDVITYLESSKVDTQTVSEASDLVANDYVAFNDSFELSLDGGNPLTGGSNGGAIGESYQKYLDQVESYTFNTMGLLADDDDTKALFASFVERMRDEMGINFQLVLHNYAADYLGVINVKNTINDDDWPDSSLVYWVTGAECGCAVNRSVQNKEYTGRFDVNVSYTQTELKEAIKAGEFVLHRVNTEIRVLSDINSMVTVTETCGEVFKDNQTIRVIDQFGNDIAITFAEKYIGVVPNNAAGRISLWSDIVKLLDELQTIGAIENYTDSDITVEEGDSKKAVLVTVSMEVVNAMDKMYMTVTVS